MNPAYLQTTHIPMPVSTPITWEIFRQGSEDHGFTRHEVVFRYSLRIADVHIMHVDFPLAIDMVTDSDQAVMRMTDQKAVSQLMRDLPEVLRRLVQSQMDVKVDADEEAVPEGNVVNINLASISNWSSRPDYLVKEGMHEEDSVHIPAEDWVLPLAYDRDFRRLLEEGATDLYHRRLIGSMMMAYELCNPRIDHQDRLVCDGALYEAHVDHHGEYHTILSDPILRVEMQIVMQDEYAHEVIRNYLTHRAG